MPSFANQSLLYLLFTILGPYLVATKASSETIGERLCWPPVLHRQHGNPEVVIKVKPGRKGFHLQYIRPLAKIVVHATEGQTCHESIDRALCDYFLTKIWDQYLAKPSLSKAENRLRLEELIPITKNEFLDIGRAEMLGYSPPNNHYHNWWKVRMGHPLSPSKDYLMVLNSLAWAERDVINPGHFTVALRKKGGSPDHDLIYDFRAPWKLDRRAQGKDAFSFPEELILTTYRENYYDWLSTQTVIRHCHVDSTFLPICDEQVFLLQNYHRKIRQSSQYRILDSNCATLGLLFLKRLLPFDTRIPKEHSIVDTPKKNIRSACKLFGGEVATTRHPSRTLELGRQISHKNATLPATPSRRKCPSYQALLQIPEIN